MPDRPDADRLLDILEEADVLATALDGRTLSDLVADPVLQRARLHALQPIGEAANHLSLDVTNRMPEIPWPQIRGMRNRIVHGYFGLDLGAVWRPAKEDVSALATAIKASGLL